jgi:BTB/POZ domain
MIKNMNKKEIIEMEVIMSEMADAKQKVKETIQYWQTILDELDRRAMEYSELLSAMKAREEEDKKRRDNVESMMKLNLRGHVFDTTKYTLLNGDSNYFSFLFSSTMWELDGNGEFFIDRCGNCFDRILEYLSTEALSTEGLNRYDEDCVYANLVYFKIPHNPRVWDYSRVYPTYSLQLQVCLQLQDGRLCGYASDGSICIHNMETNAIEKRMEAGWNFNTNIIELSDGRIGSCRCDYSIQLWNIESGLCNLTLNGHGHYAHIV